MSGISKNDREKLKNLLKWMSHEPDFNINKEHDIDEILDDYDFYLKQEASDYDLDENGDMLSCCGAVLDEDIMICPICGEHN